MKTMLRASRRLLPAGVVLLAAGAFGQDASPIEAALRAAGVPAERIDVVDGSVTATIRYREGADVPPDRVEGHLQAAFSKLAEGFPGSRTLAVAVFLEHEAISRLEASTADIVDSLRIGGDLLSHTRLKVQLDVGGRLASAATRSPPEPAAAPGGRTGSGAALAGNWLRALLRMLPDGMGLLLVLGAGAFLFAFVVLGRRGRGPGTKSAAAPPGGGTVAPPAAGSRFCMSCGQPIDPGARFCGGCGTLVGKVVAPPASAPEVRGGPTVLPAPAGRPRRALVVPLLLALLGAGLLVFAVDILRVDGWWELDGETLVAWAGAAGGLASLITAVILRRRRPSAGAQVIAAALFFLVLPCCLAGISWVCDEVLVSPGNAFFRGENYYHGTYSPKDLGEAFRWYLRAAEAGHAGAMERVAEMYGKGEGAAADPAKAAEWRAKAEASRQAPPGR